ncbi:MAG: GGDEF domain-containing protein [Candidatus Acidiferrales bacterium]
MNKTERIRVFLKATLGMWLALGAAFCVLGLAWWLRSPPGIHNPLLYSQLEITSGILALTFAAAAVVRFRGTSERLPLILTCGFLVIGATLVSASFGFLHVFGLNPGSSLPDPLPWVVGRTLLAVLLVASLVVERRFPTSHSTGREIALALFVVLLLTSMLSAAHKLLPADLTLSPNGILPRPGNLIPAGLFLVAAIGFHRRLRESSSPFDFSLYFSAVLNLACSLAASESDYRLDRPFVLAEALQLASYGVLVGGALLDNVRLLEKVRHLAVSDSLTGLANYRRLLDALESEIQRSGRTGRRFALILFDLDRLKKINDRYGHLVGSRALCRIADVLRVHCRAIDTAARYGGDEFALVLPETDTAAAREVANRICERVASDENEPPISVSAGVAVYPDDGPSVETLFEVADRELYDWKRRVRIPRNASS